MSISYEIREGVKIVDKHMCSYGGFPWYLGTKQTITKDANYYPSIGYNHYRELDNQPMCSDWWFHFYDNIADALMFNRYHGVYNPHTMRIFKVRAETIRDGGNKLGAKTIELVEEIPREVWPITDHKIRYLVYSLLVRMESCGILENRVLRIINRGAISPRNVSETDKEVNRVVPQYGWDRLIMAYLMYKQINYPLCQVLSEDMVDDKPEILTTYRGLVGDIMKC